MPADTIVKRLLDQADHRPDAPALYEKQGGVWRAVTYRSYADTVQRVGRALLSLGVEVGDTVTMLGFNRPEWVYMCVGGMAAGGAGAGIYTTSSPSEIAYIVGHCEAKVLLVENAAQWKKVEQVLGDLPKLVKVVFMRGDEPPKHDKVLSWEAFLGLGDGVSAERLRERIEALEPGGLASLIYTSGTTGPPKGVMLSHQNLSFTANVARRIADGRSSDSSLSYLPLSHIAEQMFSIHGPITMGSSIYFAESLEKVPDNLKEVQPTVFFGVPRIWEKFNAGIQGKLDLAKGFKKSLVGWARRVGTSVSALRMKGEEPRGVLAAEYALAKKLVFSKLKPAIGLGRARFCVSGAAPIAREVLEFFASLDIVVLEVYGQSEDCGPTSCNLNGRTRLGSVGPAIDGVEVKIAPDGEILVRGPNVFLGYYREPEATAEALVDGWLHSGDLGAFDSDGFLSITGRKKEIIITAGGKNIAPKNIEASLKNHKLVSEAVVIGDRRKYLTVLLTLDPEATAAFTKERGASSEGAHTLPAVRDEIQAAIDEVNRELARVETVKKFTILERPFSIEEGELTPTLKVKRKVVNEHFSREIESMYQE
jgi:long-chain acyl-CoA synthetase